MQHRIKPTLMEKKYWTIHWNYSKMEQNCKAFFESSIWHLTKAHGVTQKSIACAGYVSYI
jgi:hypothetical protein